VDDVVQDLQDLMHWRRDVVARIGPGAVGDEQIGDDLFAVLLREAGRRVGADNVAVPS